MNHVTAFASSGVAVAGSLTAAVTGDNTLAVPALWVGIGALVAAFGQAFYPWFRDWLQQQQVASQLAKLQDEFKASQQRGHERHNQTNGLLQKSNLELTEARLQIARLEGQLGVTATAVVANSANAKALAEQTGAKLPVAVPMISPVPSASDSVLILPPLSAKVQP